METSGLDWNRWIHRGEKCGLDSSNTPFTWRSWLNEPTSKGKEERGQGRPTVSNKWLGCLQVDDARMQMFVKKGKDLTSFLQRGMHRFDTPSVLFFRQDTFGAPVYLWKQSFHRQPNGAGCTIVAHSSHWISIDDATRECLELSYCSCKDECMDDWLCQIRSSVHSVLFMLWGLLMANFCLDGCRERVVWLVNFYTQHTILSFRLSQPGTKSIPDGIETPGFLRRNFVPLSEGIPVKWGWQRGGPPSKKLLLYR